jgi:hypothetical protein
VPSKTYPVEQVLTLLTQTPTRLAALTADLAPETLQLTPASEEWSAPEVLAHLRACADVWGGCMTRILAEDHPTLRAINPRAWIKQTNYPSLAFQPSLRDFTTQRAALLAVLEPLPPEGWARSAKISGAGRPLEWTVLDYAERMARHERPHIAQIARIVTTLPGSAH